MRKVAKKPFVVVKREGGIDILGLDFVSESGTGKLVILELNDTAIGLVHKHEEEDMKQMRDLVIGKMNLEVKKRDAAPAASAAQETTIAALQEQVRRLIIEKKELQERISK